MCIAIVKKSINPKYKWFAAIIRDELYSKTWEQLAAHWPQFTAAIGYKDQLSGGSWFAYNESVLAIVINREETANKTQSRGLIAPIAVGYARNAAAAAEVINRQNFEEYRAFNLLVLDRCHTFYLTNECSAIARPQLIDSDLVLLNRTFPNDFDQTRISTNFPLLLNAPEPDPQKKDWSSWVALMKKPILVKSHQDETGLNIRAAKWGSLIADFFACPTEPGEPIMHYSHQLYL